MWTKQTGSSYSVEDINSIYNPVEDYVTTLEQHSNNKINSLDKPI